MLMKGNNFNNKSKQQKILFFETTKNKIQVTQLKNFTIESNKLILQ